MLQDNARQNAQETTTENITTENITTENTTTKNITIKNTTKEEPFERTALLIGDEGLRKLSEARVAVFGVGGVGGYVVEALARSGISHLDLIDKDTVSPSNLNRQIIASRDTIGRQKVDVMRERILSVNPEADVRTYPIFYLPETAQEYDFSSLSYVVDAVDTVTAKLEIITRAKAAGVPVISAMGAGNKLDPAGFEVADIYETAVDPLARVMRRELRKRGVDALKVVYSREEPKHVDADVPGSIAFVPPVAGMILAGEVVRDLLKAE